jgi:hypothetical protein
MRRLILAISLAALTTSVAHRAPKASYASHAVAEASVNGASPTDLAESAEPLIVKTETLLSRNHFSPGEIDGQDGDSAPSYGIHGTPNPDEIGKSQSHGCVRLTNWDAVALAEMSHPGTIVRFEDQASSVAASISTTTANNANAATPVAPAMKAPDAKGLTSTSIMPPTEFAQCVSDLTARKITFEQPNDVKEEGCQLSGAIRLATVPTPFGDVTIAGKPAMLCSFGRQFSTWVQEVAAPMTLGYTGKKLAQIEIGSAFSCRARYDKPGAVPSEHAKGDAIDILSFDLANDRHIRVKDQDSDTDRDLVRALRTTACGYFTTVLGPGADAAHAEHFHFDTGLHGATSNYRICE